ncbi:hypothetical protein GXW71_06365 [Roseomonas hellenica]|uniref:Uncharacterized protein n=1 Tax=Plastoroseomonas hellenica TaxID=2687306 RepID=A0ABS5EUL2_9PROT|nr:hypothetical protein [Plastoroseomonas hellenica]MBR0663978.1 hypothetical protein [Plastoroseomonas hellenica]
MRLFVALTAVLLAAAQVGSLSAQTLTDGACHILTRRPEAAINLGMIPEPQRANYRSSEVITKRDIVCVGGHLVIDASIFSNGGNIILVGDRITLRAALDARVYRPYSLSGNFANPGPGYPSNLVGYNYENAWGILASGERPLTQTIRNAFADYYRCIDCRAEGGAALIPRMPDGVTLPMVNNSLSPAGIDVGQRITNGTDAPESALDMSVFQSGSVFLFSRELNVETNGRIIVSGIAGGIGGAGQPPSCSGRKWEVAQDWNCTNGWREVGESGAGGRGGHAGSVSFFFTDPEVSERLRREMTVGAASWLRYVGGPAASNARLVSPSEVTSPLTGTAADFRQVGVFAQAADGNEGAISVESIEPMNLLPLFYDLIRGLDGLQSYDLVELGRRIRENSSIESISFTDFLASRLYQEVASRYTAVVSSAERQIRTGRRASVESDHFLFSCFVPQNADELMPPQLRVPLNLYRSTCERDPGQVSITGYISINGGLLAINDLSASANVRIDRIALAIFDSAETWNDMLDTLNQINERVLQLYVSVERVRQENELRNLRAAAGALNARLDVLRSQNNGNQQFFRLVSAAAALGTGTGAFYGAFMELTNDTHPTGKPGETRPATTADNLQEAEAFGKAGSGLLSAWAGVAPFFAPNATAGFQGTQQQLTELRREIREAQAAYSQFMSWASNTRQQILSDQARYLVNTVYSRNRHANHLRDRLIGFDDLLKLTLLSYVNDPSNRFPVVHRNLSALAIFVSDYRRERPSVSVRAPIDTCTSDDGGRRGTQQVGQILELIQGGCALLRRGPRSRVIRFSQGEGPAGLADVPLVILSPGRGSIQVPLFGIHASSLSTE